MKLFLKILFFIFLMQSICAQTNIDKNMWYQYYANKTTFKLFSPNADSAIVKVYANAIDKKAKQILFFSKTNDGIWEAVYKGNAANLFYTFQIKYKGNWLKESVDIYARAVSANGKRAQVIDFNKELPEPLINERVYNNTNAIVVYELHVRDATIHTSAKYKGKFLGLTEMGLKNKFNEPVGLEHIKKLGVTHVQLLPIFDFNSIDETNKKPQYNWGYDPLNYNVPEGSYSTNASNPITRIRECREMINTFHKNGIGVIMDVVFNHTALTQESNFEQLCPGYYYRKNNDGSFSNASGCGNETASEQPMFRKFMKESLAYWVKMYNVDGFRFDLMAIHDIETMNEIAETLRALKPNIILYGEGWTSGDSPLPENKRCLKKNANLLNNIGVFSDDIRDGIKGSVFNHTENGFIAGIPNLEETIKFGLVGGIQHKDIDYKKVNYSKEPYANKPFQHVSYNECHDNHTLWDRLVLANPTTTKEEKIDMYKLAMGIVMTSQGISFMQAGQEMCRTKNGEENSYNKPDKINALDWNRVNEFKEVKDWVKQLIELKKNNEAFCLGTASLVQQQVSFSKAENGLIVYHTKDEKNEFIVLINGNKNDALLPLNDYKNYNIILSNKPIKLAEKTKIEGTCFSVFKKI